MRSIFASSLFIYCKHSFDQNSEQFSPEPRLKYNNLLYKMEDDVRSPCCRLSSMILLVQEVPDNEQIEYTMPYIGSDSLIRNRISSDVRVLT